jgi:large exoprotein involved in heme utilization and adhesion
MFSLPITSLLALAILLPLIDDHGPDRVTAEQQLRRNPGPRDRTSSIKEGHLVSGLDRSNNPAGLQVDTGNSLSFIGNGVTFAGGVAGVNGGGHLEVGSVSQGQVRLNAAGGGWVGDYAGISQLSDIQMTQQSLLDASGSQGSIQLQGRNISLTDGSAALIQNLGTQTSGGITVNAAGVLSLTGGSSNGVVGSALRIENLGMPEPDQTSQ